MNHKAQKTTTLVGWGLLLLTSLACSTVVVDPGPRVPLLSNPDREFPAQKGPISAVAFSPDGRWLATAGFDPHRGYQVTLWDFASGQLSRVLTSPSISVLALAFSPDGTILACAGQGEQIQLWDPATGRQLPTLSTQDHYISSLAFRPDGKWLASAGEVARLWDVQRGTPLREIAGHRGPVVRVVFSPDGKILATGGTDRTIRLHDAGTGTLLHLLQGHTEIVTSLVFRPDGKVVASGAGTGGSSWPRHGEYKLWDVQSGNLLATPAAHAGVSALAYKPDGQALARAYRGPNGLWDIDFFNPDERQTVRHYHAHKDVITGLAFRPDGSSLVSVGADGAIRIWH